MRPRFIKQTEFYVPFWKDPSVTPSASKEEFNKLHQSERERLVRNTTVTQQYRDSMDRLKYGGPSVRNRH